MVVFKGALVILIEQGDGLHAGEELAEEVALVRGVDGISLQAEAHQERVNAQDALEVRQDGDGAAAAGVYNFGPVSIFWIIACLIAFILPVVGWKYLRNKED